MKNSKKVLILASGLVLGGCIADSKYTKLDKFGVPLTNQSLEWNSDGSESTFDQWSCVLDNETNLIWEVKTEDGGLRDFHWTYTWFDPNSNDGDPGWYDRGYCLDGTRCDTSGYVEAVNELGLCGASDWRIPSSNIEDITDTPNNELLSLVDASKEYAPLIDLVYFPSAFPINTSYWTSEPFPEAPIGAVAVFFGSGESGFSSKSNRMHVRLVRSNIIEN